MGAENTMNTRYQKQSMNGKGVVQGLSSLFEERLGGMMLVRLGLTDLVEKFKQEEHALAISLKTILQLRDQEHAAFRAQLAAAHAYARELEIRLEMQVHPVMTEVGPPATSVPMAGDIRKDNASVHGAAPSPDAPPSVKNVTARFSQAVNSFATALPTTAGDQTLHSGGAVRDLGFPWAQDEFIAPSACGAAPSVLSPPSCSEPVTSKQVAAQPWPPPTQGYLARAQQLQQRLALERPLLAPGRFPEAAFTLGLDWRGGCDERDDIGGSGTAALGGALGGALVVGSHDGAAPPGGALRGSHPAVTDNDPFEHFSSLMCAPFQVTPPNPAIVAGSGEAFVFRHTTCCAGSSAADLTLDTGGIDNFR